MKKRILALLLALITVFVIIPSAVIAEDNSFETWYVGCNGLNLRVTPNVDSDPIVTYPLRTELNVIGVDSTGKWWEVYDGVNQGYVYKFYLTANKGEYAHGIPLGVFRITGYTPNPAENNRLYPKPR